MLIVFLNPSQLSYNNLKAPANGFTISNKSPCQFDFTKLTTELKAAGIVTVKKSAIAPNAFSAVSFTCSHTAITLFLKSSFVANNVTNAATSVATNVIMIPIGFAAITVFIIFCAIVTPSVVAFHTFIAAISP